VSVGSSGKSNLGIGGEYQRAGGGGGGTLGQNLPRGEWELWEAGGIVGKLSRGGPNWGRIRRKGEGTRVRVSL